VAASPTSAKKGTPLRISSGSHVLTIDGYSQAKKAFGPGESRESQYFHVGGLDWKIKLYPSGEKIRTQTS
jgi:hypothetical protein